MNNFKVIGCDTDSILFCKENEQAFTSDEQEQLLRDINSQLPTRIKFEHDGIFKRVIILKAKNYILYDDELKIKGSALKASTKEKALKDLISDLIWTMIKKEYEYKAIYKKYVLEALNVQDIGRWASKKTVTQAVLNPERTQERKILEALQGYEYSEGDKKYFYFKQDGSLGLIEGFNNDYDKQKLLSKIYQTFKIFENVIDIDLIPKYHLKTKQKELLEFIKPMEKFGVINKNILNNMSPIISLEEVTSKNSPEYDDWMWK